MAWTQLELTPMDNSHKARRETGHSDSGLVGAVPSSLFKLDEGLLSLIRLEVNTRL